MPVGLCSEYIISSGTWAELRQNVACDIKGENHQDRFGDYFHSTGRLFNAGGLRQGILFRLISFLPLHDIASGYKVVRYTLR